MGGMAISVDPGFLGGKLRALRDQLQIELDELSHGTGIEAAKLQAFEEGMSLPSGDEILVLADFYKYDYKFFISSERLTAFEQTGKLYRRHGKELSRTDRWVIQEFLYLCECEEFLVRELGRPRIEFQFRKTTTYYKGQAETAAAELRNRLEYRDLDAPPDVFSDFRKLGFHVFRRPLANSQISGMFVNHPVAGKCLLVNYDEDIFRQRFSVAHEAGHAILDDKKDFVVSFSWDKKSLSEIRANAFAARYLIPLSLLHTIPEPETWPKRKIIDWCKKLKVSSEVLAYSLEEADLIPDSMVNWITTVKLPRDSKIDPEIPVSLAPKSRERRTYLLQLGLSSFYVNLCFDAYDQKLISAGKLAEMLLVDQIGLMEIANLFHRRIAYDL